MHLFDLLIKSDHLNASTARPFSDRLDWALFSITMLIGAAFTYYIHSIGLSLVLVDHFSHLSIARQITDSLTPGMSQVGFWPPLLHIILAPVAIFDSLYYSGISSAFVLVPVLGLGVVWLARLLFLLTGERLISYVFASLLLVNPYLLYFSVTPMMEVLFISMLIGSTYFFTRWWLMDELSSLIFSGVLISLASLSRFEGFIIIPLVTLLITFRLVKNRVSFTQIEALLLIFGLMASTGVIFTLVYGAVYNGDPLAFMSNDWGAYAQQRELNLPGEGNLLMSVVYMSAAASEILGTLSLLTAILSFLLLCFTLKKQRLLILSVIAILGSPFIFDVMASYQGSAVIYLPYLPPYQDGYFNVRYGLLLAAVLNVLPALVAAQLAKVYRGANSWSPVHLILALYIVIFTVVGLGSHIEKVGCPDCFAVIQKSNQISPAYHKEAAEALRLNYDGGYILMTRALHNEIAVRAEIPLSHYILEANEHYYGRTLEAPWWFARYVVMFNPNDNIHQAWQQQNEIVSRTWSKNSTFHYYYDQIYLSEGTAVYKINEKILKEKALRNDIPLASIPSLQTENNHWDVEETYKIISQALAENRLSIQTL